MSVNFQNEVEVKEYLENIGIEYRFGCYSEKKPDVCHLLGDYLETIHKDFGKARKIYQSTCDDYGYAKSCLKYGHYTFIGKGTSGAKPNPNEALKYYEKGCKLDDGENCLNSGLLLISPKMEGQRDFSKGIEYLTKSCELNNANACFYLSGMHISGAEGPAPSKSEILSNSKLSTDKNTSLTKAKEFVLIKDMEKAFAFTYKACELKNMYACANLSQMYARGEGTEQNEKKAEMYKKIAIELQEQVVNNKGQLVFQQTS